MKKIYSFSGIMALAAGLVTGTVSAQCPAINCPGNISVNNTPGSCGAVVNYVAPVGTNPCGTSPQTYSYTGGVQTFVVPSGVTSITVNAYGAQGGNAAGPGGLGGLATATVPVSPGEVINVYVGGRGVDGNAGGNGAGGYNGGGTGWQLAVGNGGSGGGGASDIRRSPYTLNDRLVVGGGGGGSENTGGGAMQGGYGGGLTGGDGQVWGGNTATGGSQNAGGVANTGLSCDGNLVLALNGSFGQGGDGGRCTLTRCGGGGGGGWYGGGGVTRGNGSGGGSGYVAAPGNTNTSMSNGVQSGNGQVVISWVGGNGASTAQTAGLPSGSTFPVGVTTNTFTVTDIRGNTLSCSFTVTVTDNESPVVTAPANITVNNDPGTCGAVVNFNAPAGTDNCSATTALTAGMASGSTFPVGTTTETYTATDAAGNSASASFTITVVDNENPVITCPGNITASNDAGTCGAVVTYNAPVASDNCSAIVTQTAGLSSGSIFPVGVTTNTFTATDPAGLVSTCSFTVTITDNELPMISCSPDVTSCSPVVNGIAPASSDNCAGTTVTYALTGATTGNGNSDASGTTFNVGTTLVTYTATDAAGNSSNCSFNVTIHPSYTTNATASICQGDAIMLGGAMQNQSGTYYDSLSTNMGCDSVIATVLTVNPLPNVTLAVFNNDTVCVTVAPFALPAGNPAGGSYSGPGVVGNNFSPSQANVGTHTIVYMYTDGNGCKNSDSTMITVLSCQGIQAQSSLKPSVYPNPTSGQVLISLGASYKNIEVSVLELNGRLVRTDKYNYTNSVTTDLKDLSTGMYFLQIKADGQTSMVKIAKN